MTTMLDDLNIEFLSLPGAVHVRHARVDAQQWRACCESADASNGRLVALWGSDAGGTYEVHAALADISDLAVLTLPLAGASYPDISDIFPAAIRMQRATHDLLGIFAEGAADARKWLRHSAWRAN